MMVRLKNTILNMIDEWKKMKPNKKHSQDYIDGYVNALQTVVNLSYKTQKQEWSKNDYKS